MTLCDQTGSFRVANNKQIASCYRDLCYPLCTHEQSLAERSYLGQQFGTQSCSSQTRNVKFAVVSCFITVNWKHVAGGQHCWWRSRAHPIGAKLSLGPRGTGLRLFIQIAGKHSVFSKRRQLLLQFCPLFLSSVPSFFVFLTSAAEHRPLGNPSSLGQKFLVLGIPSVMCSPTSTPLQEQYFTLRDMIHSAFKEMWFTVIAAKWTVQSELCKVNCACVRWHLIPTVIT